MGWSPAAAVKRSLVALGFITVLGLVSFVAACSQEEPPGPSSRTEERPATTEDSSSKETRAPLRILKISPEKGTVGTPFSVRGEGFAPGAEVEFIWTTFEGSYDATVEDNRAVFYERQFSPVRRVLGRTTADAGGEAGISLTAPEDFGGIRDIYAVVDGQDVAKGGFNIMRHMTISPTDGPVGTPITVKVTGLGAGPWDSTTALLYDNKYTGFVSATTTGGTATFQIRAAGPVGKHYMRLGTASHALTYFNQEQSPPFWGPPLRETFTVIEGSPAPPAALQWPASEKVGPHDASTPRTTILGRGAGSGIAASLSEARGPILSDTVLSATGLSSNAEVDVLWATAAGNDVTGWNIAEESLTRATSDTNGAVDVSLGIPETLGGWHAILLVENEKVVAELPYYVERSFVTVSPPQVKQGEVFKVEIKGVGWTELDNGVAVLYDNGYIGYACGFCCNGDVSLYIEATGGSGVHLIELYPMIYDGGHGKWPWQYNLPQLTALDDHPGLALGYNLPIFRLAVEVTP